VQNFLDKLLIYTYSWQYTHANVNEIEFYWQPFCAYISFWLYVLKQMYKFQDYLWIVQDILCHVVLWKALSHNTWMTISPTDPKNQIIDLWEKITDYFSLF